MRMLQEFRDFAIKGNAVDMAIGIIIGGAFTPIVRSLVDDILMPPIGLLLGGADFSAFKLVLQRARTAADGSEVAEVAITYGNFINLVVSFLLIALAVFMLVKGINRLRREEEAPPASPTTKDCPQCLMTIPLAAHKCGHCTAAV